MSDVENEAPHFSCRHKSRAIELHTHAKSEDGFVSHWLGGVHPEQLG